MRIRYWSSDVFSSDLESTVSRVTSNKTMATPRGIFEMKYFFTASIAATEGGEAFSAESIRHRIKALIDAEIAEDVLSDDKIVEMLAGKGVDIARRTVAKYREAMNIPSSVERRRLKKAGLLSVGCGIIMTSDLKPLFDSNRIWAADKLQIG